MGPHRPSSIPRRLQASRNGLMNGRGGVDFSEGPQDCPWCLCAVCARCKTDVPSDLNDSEIDWYSGAAAQPEPDDVTGMSGGSRDARKRSLRTTVTMSTRCRGLEEDRVVVGRTLRITMSRVSRGCSRNLLAGKRVVNGGGGLVMGPKYFQDSKAEPRD